MLHQSHAEITRCHARCNFKACNFISTIPYLIIACQGEKQACWQITLMTSMTLDIWRLQLRGLPTANSERRAGGAQPRLPSFSPPTGFVHAAIDVRDASAIVYEYGNMMQGTLWCTDTCQSVTSWQVTHNSGMSSVPPTNHRAASFCHVTRWCKDLW